jgi:hypothetical protein
MGETNVKRTISERLFVVTLVLLMSVLAYSQPAKQPARTSNQAPKSDGFAYVPQSDGVVIADVNRLLNETLPRVFAGDSAKLAQINSEIEKFKTQTGVDPRVFHRVVVAARYTHPTPRVTKLEPVAIAVTTGKRAPAAMSAARLAAKGKARDEKYHGSEMIIVTVDDQMKVFGLWNMRVHELAIATPNGNTVLIGSPAMVRAAIDAGRTARRDSVELIGLATRDPQAVVGFGANVPKAVWSDLNLGTDAIAEDAGSIRQAYGSIGTTATDLSLTLVARTETAVNAKNLSDTLNSLKQLAFFAIMRLSGDQRELAQSALANLKVSSRANEVEVRTHVTAAHLASLMK